MQAGDGDGYLRLTNEAVEIVLLRVGQQSGRIRGRRRDGGVSLALKARVARYLETCGYTREAASAAAAKYSGHSGRVGMYTAIPKPASPSRRSLRSPDTSR